MLRFARAGANRLLHSYRQYHELSFAGTGDPSSVLDYRQSSNDPPVISTSATSSSSSRDDLVHVHMLAAPWNPADFMSVRGNYPSPYASVASTNPIDDLRCSLLSPTRSVAGSEGLGIVRAAPRNSKLKEGDYVVPGMPSLGTYRSSLWVPTTALIRVRRGSELLSNPVQAAPLFQTAGTALRMLNDFVDLGQGDALVQNAGNSAVGLMVSQLAAAKGLKCISIVRKNRRTEAQMQTMTDYLMQSGNDLVLAEEDFSKEDFRSFYNTYGYPKLALNAVGGTSAGLLLKLCQGGTMVTYGGMSKLPVSIPTSHLIFRDTRIVGYWHSRWMAQQSTALERTDMINSIVDAALSSTIKCPAVAPFALADYKQAFQEEAKQSCKAIRCKIVFDLTQQ